MENVAKVQFMYENMKRHIFSTFVCFSKKNPCFVLFLHLY
jgi:hypothetical protein